jgi:hypothetical protein
MDIVTSPTTKAVGRGRTMRRGSSKAADYPARAGTMAKAVTRAKPFLNDLTAARCALPRYTP